MGKFLAILFGLIAVVGGAWLAVAVWWQEFYELVFGFIPPILFFGGLIALIAGISSMKDAKRTKQLEEETEETPEVTPQETPQVTPQVTPEESPEVTPEEDKEE
jgi:hypothetical protein